MLAWGNLGFILVEVCLILKNSLTCTSLVSIHFFTSVFYSPSESPSDLQTLENGQLVVIVVIEWFPSHGRRT